MARQTKRLAARFVDTVTEPRQYADGDGLYLIVSPNGAKRWTFLFRFDGKRSEMGLGKLSAVSLADARQLAQEARQSVARGINPVEARKAQRQEAKASVMTFGRYADQLIDSLAPGFRNDKHKAQWRMTLGDTYCAKLRPMRLDQIDTPDVLAVLSPIWTTKAETASRLRGRIERVLDAAKAEGYRTGENPARWRGHLSTVLPKRQKLTRGHHAAMPYDDVPALFARLTESEGMGALALRFTILTAARTSEAHKAQWSEIDLGGSIWTIPGERMKAGKPHRVPLSGAALAIVTALHEARTSEYVFPGLKPHKPISSGTMTKALTLAGGDTFTVHGFRSSFRDWAGDRTSFAREVAEAALAHAVGNESERSYRRGDALEKRRQLMEAWQDFLTGTAAANVVPLDQSRRTTGSGE